MDQLLLFGFGFLIFLVSGTGTIAALLADRQQDAVGEGSAIGSRPGLAMVPVRSESGQVRSIRREESA